MNGLWTSTTVHMRQSHGPHCFWPHSCICPQISIFGRFYQQFWDKSLYQMNWHRLLLQNSFSFLYFKGLFPSKLWQSHTIQFSNIPQLSQSFGQIPFVITGQLGLLWHHDCACNATPAFICGQRQHYEHQGQQGAPVVKDTAFQLQVQDWAHALCVGKPPYCWSYFKQDIEVLPALSLLLF